VTLMGSLPVRNKGEQIGVWGLGFGETINPGKVCRSFGVFSLINRSQVIPASAMEQSKDPDPEVWG